MRVWDFVEQYYPDYSRCQEVARMSNLDKLVGGEYEDGDGAHWLLVNEFDNNLDSLELKHQQKLQEAYILEEAIKGFIKETKWTNG